MNKKTAEKKPRNKSEAKPGKKTAEKPDMGRPSSYRPEYAEQAAEVFSRGATLQEAADHFGVARSTIQLWLIRHDDFSVAVKAGKDVADDRVELSLYERAIGYSHEATKIFMPAGATEPVCVPYIERFPPDPGACLNWLKNRRPDKWRDKQELEHSGAVTLEELVLGSYKLGQAGGKELLGE
jgi:transposase-like protein